MLAKGKSLPTATEADTILRNDAWRYNVEQQRNEHNRLNEEKWNSRAKTFDDRRFNYFRFMQKRLVSLLDLKENQHLLDLGCGTGWAVRYAASLVNNRENSMVSIFHLK